VHLFLFTDYISSYDVRYQTGYSLIALVLFNTFVNFLYFMYLSLKALWLYVWHKLGLLKLKQDAKEAQRITETPKENVDESAAKPLAAGGLDPIEEE